MKCDLCHRRFEDGEAIIALRRGAHPGEPWRIADRLDDADRIAHYDCQRATLKPGEPSTSA